MAVKTITESSPLNNGTDIQTNKARGELCTIRGKEYYIRYPKAKDMISLEKTFSAKNAGSFTQALLMIQELSEDKNLTYEFLEDLYLDELTDALELFQKLLPN